MSRKRAILAWECGAGRGHVGKLKAVAQALRDRFDSYAVLHDMRPAHELEGLTDQVFPCDSLRGRPDIVRAMKATPGASWAEYLHMRGFCDPDYLVERAGAWRKAFELFNADLLIASYAPAAMLAARTMGLPVIVAGTGYGIAPAGSSQFAVYLEDYSTRFTSEAEMCSAMNAAISRFGGKPLVHAPDLYDVDVQLVSTICELDPYQERTVDRLAPGDDVSSFISDGSGDEVFIYFSTSERSNPVLMEAVRSLDLPVRAFMPGASQAEIDACRASGMIMETGPVPVDLLARRTRLMVHAGQHGITNLAFAAGIAQLAIPQHLEQLFTARRIRALGAGTCIDPREVEVASFCDLVRSLYADKELRSAACDFAHHKRPVYLQDVHAAIRAACANV